MSARVNPAVESPAFQLQVEKISQFYYHATLAWYFLWLTCLGMGEDVSRISSNAEPTNRIPLCTEAIQSLCACACHCCLAAAILSGTTSQRAAGRSCMFSLTASHRTSIRPRPMTNTVRQSFDAVFQRLYRYKLMSETYELTPELAAGPPRGQRRPDPLSNPDSSRATDSATRRYFDQGAGGASSRRTILFSASSATLTPRPTAAGAGFFGTGSSASTNGVMRAPTMTRRSPA